MTLDRNDLYMLKHEEPRMKNPVFDEAEFSYVMNMTLQEFIDYFGDALDWDCMAQAHEDCDFYREVELFGYQTYQERFFVTAYVQRREWMEQLNRG